MPKQRNELETYQRNRGYRYKADFNGGTRVIYEGWADPHKLTSQSEWQIVKHTYDASNYLIASEWARNSNGVATDDFVHEWDERANLTYGPE